jgi:hypothetical protein
MTHHEDERRQQVADQISNSAIDGRDLAATTADAASPPDPITEVAALVAGEVQRTNRAALRGSYDYVIVGAGRA